MLRSYMKNIEEIHSNSNYVVVCIDDDETSVNNDEINLNNEDVVFVKSVGSEPNDSVQIPNSPDANRCTLSPPEKRVRDEDDAESGAKRLRTTDAENLSNGDAILNLRTASREEPLRVSQEERQPTSDTDCVILDVSDAWIILEDSVTNAKESPSLGSCENPIVLDESDANSSGLQPDSATNDAGIVDSNLSSNSARCRSNSDNSQPSSAGRGPSNSNSGEHSSLQPVNGKNSSSNAVSSVRSNVVSSSLVPSASSTSVSTLVSYVPDPYSRIINFTRLGNSGNSSSCGVLLPFPLTSFLVTREQCRAYANLSNHLRQSSASIGQLTAGQINFGRLPLQQNTFRTVSYSNNKHLVITASFAVNAFSKYDPVIRSCTRNDIAANFLAAAIPEALGPSVRRGELRPVVIDGSNVAYSHGKEVLFSCKGIKICVEHFLRRGHASVKAFVPQFRRRSSAEVVDRQILETLATGRQHVVFTPSRNICGREICSYDDRFLLEYSHQTGAIVVSNDNFRDLIDEDARWREIIVNRLLMYAFADDVFMIPQDPLGRSGPSLDNFLRTFIRTMPCKKTVTMKFQLRL